MEKSEAYTWLLYGVAVIVLLNSQVLRLEAETFYVDPINGNMSNDGSYDYPWETLQAVFGNELIETRVYETLPPGPNTPFVIKNAGAPVKAGDTILLRSGYHGGVNYKGAFNSDYITIAAQEGHTPYLKRIRLISVSKWILRGLTVSPEPASKNERLKKQVLIFVGTDKLFGASDDIIIENNNLFSVEDSTPWTTFDLSKDGSVNLKDFAILALYWQDNQCEQSDSCAGSDFDNSGIVNSADLAIFSNNWLDDWNTLSCRGIQLHSSNSIVRNNTLKNVDFGIVAAGDNMIVEHNEIENIAGDGIVGSADNLTIQYNTIKNFYQVNANHDDMIQFHRGSDKTTPIYNAVIRGNFVASVDVGQTNPLLKVQTQGINAFENDCPYIGWLVENNVVITQHGNAITLGGAQDSIIVNNIIFDPTGRSSARISLGGIYDWKPDVPIETGIWTHVALTCDGSTITMYKNGVNVATTRGWADLMLADPSSDESFYIGRNTEWGEYFKGIIDEVRVYNRALSATEIAQLYAPPQVVTVSSVVGMAQAAAQSEIISASLNVGAISHAYSTTVPAGEIIIRNPAAGTSVVINSVVDPVVSDGAAPDLILDMRFDEGTGTIAGDSSGSANHGMLINGPIWTTGQVNGGLSFDGSNDYVEVTDDPSFDIVDEITIAAWINPVDANIFRTILSKFAHTPDYRKDLYWFLYDGRIGASLAGPSGGGKNVVVRNNMAYSFHLLGENITEDHNIDINDYDPNAFFVNWENLNLRHRYGSPAIDAGSSKLASGIDIDDIPRPYGRAHDIGAYEYTLLCDINRDGTVNFKDCAILAYYWHDNACRQSDLCRVCDFNQDEIVDINDLIIFVNQWLEGRTLMFDWNNDGIVNFLDYAIFASYWWDNNCEQSDWCRGADYDSNGMLDFDDLTFFADSWLIQ
ncbi:MAG: PASTA domain-containing protein [Planctomycetes bacterium]|nr:PASTA domain-containing protein [Planctomycetota bacterium]